MTDTCFHCGLDLPRQRFFASVQAKQHAVCCLGCKAVAELIDQSGMSQYYDLREKPPGQAFASSQAFEKYDGLDDLYIQQTEDLATANIFVDGMHCSACCWLVESRMNGLNGVTAASVDPLSHRLSVTWEREDLKLSEILSRLAAIGYRPEPLTGNAEPERQAVRQSMKRLVVASVGMMQVMMFAIGLYSGDAQGMAPDMEYFLRLVSMLVTTPVVLYSARPIFEGAVRGLLQKRPGMDVPVALAIALAFTGSVYASFTHASDVWFDSVTMFIFFLTLARHIELLARTDAARRADALRPLLPGTAEKLTDNGVETVPVSTLKIHDRVRVRPGAYIPFDGQLLSENMLVDEAVLTGESEPQRKTRGMTVLAGSLCIDNSVELQATRVGAATRLAQIRSICTAAKKPHIVQLADRIASYFVSAVLLLAGLVAAIWWVLDPDRAFVVTLSVLVVTCPCALALATPTVFAAASRRLAECGLLLRRTDALAALAKVDIVVFDKTGTLTLGRPQITSFTSLRSGFDEAQALQIAGALEQHSTHPLARAFNKTPSTLTANAVTAVPGKGIEGLVDSQCWYLGNRQYVERASGHRIMAATEDDASHVFLGDARGACALFVLRDNARAGSAQLVQQLSSMGLDVRVSSGDRAANVASLAQQLGIATYAAAQSPEDKLGGIRRLQAQGRVVLMVGDGVNDGPVLAAADVSIAPASGADLAQHEADIIMTSEDLSSVANAIQTARRAHRIIRQNLAWAVSYNLLALPAAALGIVPTWLAAIGMSASSLVVVINATRVDTTSREAIKTPRAALSPLAAKVGRRHERAVQ